MAQFCELSDQSVEGNGRTSSHMAYTPDVWSKSTLSKNFREWQTGNKPGKYNSSLTSLLNKEQKRHRIAVFSDLRLQNIFCAVLHTF